MKILFYDTPYYLFSNWSAHMVEYKGILYPTAEHAYHCQRFTDKEIIKEIKESKSPFEAKAIARNNLDKQIGDWDEIKISVMKEIIKAKIDQHREVQNALKASGEAEIVENSPLDYFWGIGENSTGQNQLGKIWMELRAEIVK